jgi:hypothetical protein
MKQARKLLVVAWSILLFVACGGGADRTDPTTSSASAADPEPTAVLTATDANAASELANEVQQASEEAAQMGRLSGTQALPTGGTVTYNCAQFLGAGATGTVTYTHPDTPPAAGWKSSITFANCTYAVGTSAYALNGTVWYEYLRYVSGSDFGFRGTTENLAFSYSSNGVVVGQGMYSFNHTFDLHNNVIRTSYANARGTIRDLRLARSGDNVVVNAVFVGDLKTAGGKVRMEITDWTYDLSTGHAASGTVRIIGANGTRVDIVASTAGYTITYRAADGTTTVYTLTRKG